MYSYIFSRMPSIPVARFIRVCTLLADLSNFAGGTCEIVLKNHLISKFDSS